MPARRRCRRPRWPATPARGAVLVEGDALPRVVRPAGLAGDADGRIGAGRWPPVRVSAPSRPFEGRGDGAAHGHRRRGRRRSRAPVAPAPRTARRWGPRPDARARGSPKLPRLPAGQGLDGPTAVHGGPRPGRRSARRGGWLPDRAGDARRPSGGPRRRRWRGPRRAGTGPGGGRRPRLAGGPPGPAGLAEHVDDAEHHGDGDDATTRAREAVVMAARTRSCCPPPVVSGDLRPLAAGRVPACRPRHSMVPCPMSLTMPLVRL